MKNADIETARKIAEKAALLGGSVYYVGGFVRDKLRGTENKDVDIEVHGINPAQLEGILDSLGQRLEMGKSFGVYGLRGCSLDIAMPRKEHCRGTGHKDFDIFVDPYIGVEKAARRRDFTVNALMQNVLTGEIIDCFGGREDLEKRVLRHVDDEAFAEDPLRVLRAAQFAARFGFSLAPETVELCRSIGLSALPKERVFEELSKALLKAEKPSVFFRVLRETGQLSIWFPELEALIGVEQNPRFHAEGDVWEHTLLVLDAAAALRGRTQSPIGFMLAALVHDFGKAVTTERINGVIHAYGHETEGLKIEENFLVRLTNEKKLREYALNLSALHMKPNMEAEHGSAVKSTNKLFDQATDPEALICIALADTRGRISDGGERDHEAFLYERLNIYREYMSRPYVMGKDLIEAGVSPSEHFSEYLAYAHKLRLAGTDKASALRQTLAMAKTPPHAQMTAAKNSPPSEKIVDFPEIITHY